MGVQRLSHLSLSNMEVFIAVVDDDIVLAAGSDVANALFIKGKHNKIKTAGDILTVNQLFCNRYVDNSAENLWKKEL